MQHFDIQKLRDLPIEGVAERLGLTVSKHKALCPFHADSHPSLTFHVKSNSFKCFVCGNTGGCIDLAMKVLGMNFVDACQWLADEHAIILEKRQPIQKTRNTYQLDVEYLQGLIAQPMLNAEAQEFLFTVRRYHPTVVRWLGISSISSATPCWRYGRPYYDAPSLLIPYRDIHGNLLSVQSRYLGKRPDTPRFRFPKGGKCGIYNLPVLKLLKAGEPLFISEGVTDCMALLSAGHKAIAIPSATLLSREDRRLLKDFVREYGRLDLHMYPDADIPGEKLYLELVGLANELDACLTRHSLPAGCKDFSDYWRQQSSAINPL